MSDNLFIKNNTPANPIQSNKKLLSLGVLFKQTNKTKERSPDMVGELLIERADFQQLLEQFQANPDQPVEVRLAAWLKVSRNGKSYLNVQLSPPLPKQQPKPAADEKSSLNEFLGGKDGDGR